MNTRTPNAKAKVLGLEDAAKRVGMHTEPFRRLVKAGKGPPATKRPGSNRWFLWANEFFERLVREW